VGEVDLERSVEAWVRDRVVEWTIRWARSSKTEDCCGVRARYEQSGCWIITWTSR
jgi:hypothetical protein